MSRWRLMDVFLSGKAVVWVHAVRGHVSGEAMLEGQCKCGWSARIYTGGDEEGARVRLASLVDAKHECLGGEEWLEAMSDEEWAAYMASGGVST